MRAVALCVEPSPWLDRAIQNYSHSDLHTLVPWRVPGWAPRFAPPSLKRFVSLRAAQGRGALGYPALELATRLYSRGRRDKMFQCQFALRQASSIWASRTPELRLAHHVLAPSLSARRLFAARSKAEAILLLDLPLFRTMHEDLDRAAAAHPDCKFLRRYRAPSWAIVEQECEIAMADHIVVRGRFARQELIKLGVSPDRITIVETAYQPITPNRLRAHGLLRVMLPGLAAARHGTAQLLASLETRPWLRIALRPGEGAEPESLMGHPQVSRANATTLSEVDAVVAPSLCEAYFPEVRIAAASGIPVVATMRGAGAVSHEELTIELPSAIERGLACALDALHDSDPSDHGQSVSGQLSH